MLQYFFHKQYTVHLPQFFYNLISYKNLQNQGNLHPLAHSVNGTLSYAVDI